MADHNHFWDNVFNLGMVVDWYNYTDLGIH